MKQFRRDGGKAILSNENPHLVTKDGNIIRLETDASNDHVLLLRPGPTTTTTPRRRAGIFAAATSAAATAAAIAASAVTTATTAVTKPTLNAGHRAATTYRAGLILQTLVAVAVVGTACTALAGTIIPGADGRHGRLTRPRVKAPQLMPGLELDGDRAHHMFAHAAPACLDKIMDFYGVPAPKHQTSLFRK